MNTPAQYAWLDDQGPAFGSPGLPPRWTSSRKDAVSTAYSASSLIWFTLSHGTLNELYWPTIDRPQTRDMELLFTDGETFFHEEKRDFEYNFHYPDPGCPAVRVVADAPGKAYTVTKEVISNPHHPVVLMHVTITGDEAVVSKLKCYALLSPHLEGGGAGKLGALGGRRRQTLRARLEGKLLIGPRCRLRLLPIILRLRRKERRLPGSLPRQADELAVRRGPRRQHRHHG